MNQQPNQVPQIPSNEAADHNVRKALLTSGAIALGAFGFADASAHQPNEVTPTDFVSVPNQIEAHADENSTASSVTPHSTLTFGKNGFSVNNPAETDRDSTNGSSEADNHVTGITTPETPQKDTVETTPAPTDTTVEVNPVNDPDASPTSPSATNPEADDPSNESDVDDDAEAVPAPDEADSDDPDTSEPANPAPGTGNGDTPPTTTPTKGGPIFADPPLPSQPESTTPKAPEICPASAAEQQIIEAAYADKDTPKSFLSEAIVPDSSGKGVSWELEPGVNLAQDGGIIVTTATVGNGVISKQYIKYPAGEAVPVFARTIADQGDTTPSIKSVTGVTEAVADDRNVTYGQYFAADPTIRGGGIAFGGYLKELPRESDLGKPYNLRVGSDGKLEVEPAGPMK